MRKRTEIVNELCAAIEQDRRSLFNIAQAAGVTDKALYHWLSGRTSNPKIDSIAQVAQVLGLQVVLVDGQPRLKPLKPLTTTPEDVKRQLEPLKRARLALWRLQ
jgi:transcriptional regulator with XRE-family HTH domain